jgi:hypothetical protein
MFGRHLWINPVFKIKILISLFVQVNTHAIWMKVRVAVGPGTPGGWG